MPILETTKSCVDYLWHFDEPSDYGPPPAILPSAEQIQHGSMTNVNSFHSGALGGFKFGGNLVQFFYADFSKKFYAYQYIMNIDRFKRFSIDFWLRLNWDFNSNDKNLYKDVVRFYNSGLTDTSILLQLHTNSDIFPTYTFLLTLKNSNGTTYSTTLAPTGYEYSGVHVAICRDSDTNVTAYVEFNDFGTLRSSQSTLTVDANYQFTTGEIILGDYVGTGFTTIGNQQIDELRLCSQLKKTAAILPPAAAYDM